MKRKHIILALLCMALLQITGLAVQFETEIFADIPREEVVEKTLAAVNALEIDTFTEEDIDFSEAMKYYYHDGLRTDNAEDALAVVQGSEYSWKIPLTGENNHILVTFILGLPVEEEFLPMLTPEQIAQAEARVGSWNVTNTAVGNDNMAWKDRLGQALDTLTEETTVYFTAGTPFVPGPFAYVVTEESVSVVPYSTPNLLDTKGYTMADTVFNFSDLKSINVALEAENLAQTEGRTDLITAMPSILDVLEYAQHKNQSATPLVWGGIFFVAVVLFGIKLWNTKA